MPILQAQGKPLHRPHWGLLQVRIAYIAALFICTFCIFTYRKTQIYDTWVFYSEQEEFRCWSAEVSSDDIQAGQGDSGPIYTIRSENYGEWPYYPRRLQYFNIKCPGGGIILPNMTSELEGQKSLTISHKTLNYCVDYVDVLYKDTKSSCQMCGNQTIESKGCQDSFEGEILVTFRSSRLHNFKGFEMNVVCYQASEQNLPGCIQTLPAKKEKSMSSQGDSHSSYSTVRKCTKTINTVYNTIIFAFNDRSSYLQMRRHS